jgi:ribosome biogenesis GTPase
LKDFTVAEVQRDRVTLHDGEFFECVARLMPALVQALSIDDDMIAVGDRVSAERNALGEWWIGARQPPRTQLSRRDTHGRRQVLAANVDTGLLVMGLDADFNLKRLDRYLALVRLAGVQPVVVLTKADECPRTEERLGQVRAHVPSGVDAVAVDGRDARTRDMLRPWMAAGRTLVLLGSSGAGKSTLTNTLVGQAVQDTGGVRHGDSRGRHTTTARSLHRLEGGAAIIDTPGLRTLRLDTDDESLDAVFDDIGRWAARCRFRDCAHAGEPGCAVREAVAPERLANWRKLQREVRRDTLNALERRQMLAQWKARGRMAAQRLKDKRGEDG